MHGDIWDTVLDQCFIWSNTVLDQYIWIICHARVPRFYLCVCSTGFKTTFCVRRGLRLVRMVMVLVWCRCKQFIQRENLINI